jgi:PBP1b-binding outer membrane lipoprotein LpoB|tara:strand:+ start:3848 stop:4162 length:315 start_codon:yes stop_codon:yes gene_type:complete
MKFIKLIISISILSIILSSCSTFSEAGKVLRNEKRTTDEFLIQKKDPLTTPPDFDEIPKPGSINERAKSNSIEKIIKTDKKNKPDSELTTSSTTEESILKRIKK